MIQIVDISKQMLYDQLKAEKDLLMIINATVSHELRNPLYSLISQILRLDDQLFNFEDIIQSIQNKEFLTFEEIKVLYKNF